MGDRRLFALSDPHLSLSGAKPMDVFGPAWADHTARLAANWRQVVRPEDIVLVPGDISWGMKLPDALPDLQWLAALPGRKVLLRGNHDYWWKGPKKLEALRLPDTYFIQGTSVVVDDIAIGGGRMWDFPGIHWGAVANADNPEVAPALRAASGPVREEDPDRIRERELTRLTASLESLSPAAAVRVVMTHFPPLGEDGLPTMLTDRIGSYDIDLCVFGHVHAHPDRPRPGEDIHIGKTRYVLASSDFLHHTPIRLL
ncbi:MAG: metallophosphoesterase [Planctomycetes bacterium]|nr:metallophosphoesterase [Planctomycetota bacterium]